MPAIAAAIGLILGYLVQVMTILNLIKTLAQNAAKEHADYQVETQGANTELKLLNLTYGLAAAHTERREIHDDLQSAREAILAAFDGLCQSGTSPSWWVDPPPAGPSAVDIQEALWGTDMGITDLNADTVIFFSDLLTGIYQGLNGLMGHTGSATRNPYVSYVTSEMGLQGYSQRLWWPTYSAEYEPAPFPVDQLLETDTALSFVQRVQPTVGWTDLAPGDGVQTGHIWAPASGDPTRRRWHLNLTDEDCKRLWHEAHPFYPEIPAPLPVAPVWPGSASVTLGSSVALTSQLVVVAAMDGLLVDVTTPPGKLGSYLVGGSTLDYGVGRVAFESDNGDLEPWQYLGFRQAIYTPRSMARAAKARFQVLGGAGGTVTPWVRS